MTSYRRHPAVLPFLICFLAVAAGATNDGTLSAVASHYAAGQWVAARNELSAVAERQPTVPGGLIWGQRLTTDPGRALELAQSQVRDRNLTPVQRLEAALDGASIALAGGELETAWALVEPLIAVTTVDLPGELYLLAGVILNQAGDYQRAREMLASVRPDDPHFATARSLLGRIGLETGDTELALNYFDAALRRLERPQPDLEAGRWQALQLLGRRMEAREAYASLVERHPLSLAAMEVRERRLRDDEELAAVIDTLDVVAPDVLESVTVGLYSVQLAAFRDRALAMQFVRRWQVELPDLRIEREADDLGQPLYRIQTGDFVSRALASTELARLEREHGLKGFVAGGTER